MLHTVETKAPWCKQNKKNKSQCIECQINAWDCIASLTKYSFGLLVYLYLVLYWYHWYICRIENIILMLILFYFQKPCSRTFLFLWKHRWNICTFHCICSKFIDKSYDPLHQFVHWDLVSLYSFWLFTLV